MHPDDLERCIAIYVESFDARSAFSMEYRLRHRSGEYRWILDNGVPRFSPANEFEGFIGACVDIHAQRQYEDQLNESRIRFEALANNIPQLAWMTDGTGWTTWYNRQWLDFTGTTLEEMQGWGWKKVHHPDHSERVTEKWLRHLKSGEPWEDTFPLRRADGEYRWFLSLARAIRDDQGKIISWFGTNTDVTEQRETESKLAELRSRVVRERGKYEAIFAKSPTAIALVRGPKHVFEMANSKYIELVGDRPLIGKPVLEALPEILNQPFVDWLNSVFTTGVAFSLNDAPITLNRREGQPEIRFVDFVYQRIEEGGEPYGVFVQVIDTTDKVIARQTLRESESKFRSLADSVPGVVWSANPDGRVDYYSKRWFDVTGIDPKADPNSWPQVVHPDDMDRVSRHWTECIAEEKLYEIECRIWSQPAREYRWVLGRGVPVRDEKGHVTKWFGTNTDIHELRLMQQALSEAVRARDEFLSIASHELKTPLTSLMLQAQMMRRSMSKQGESTIDPKRVASMVDLTEKQVSRLSRLVDDMLDVSRIRSGNLRIEPDRFDFCEMVTEALDRMKGQFASASYPAPELKLCAPKVGEWDRLRLE